MAGVFQLHRTQQEQNTFTEQLITGKKVNRGGDDPAALITSEQLNAELARLEAESRALQRTDTSATIVDGYVGEISGLMTDLRRLEVSSANQAGMSKEEIAANQVQVDSIVSNIHRLSNQARDALGDITLPDGGNGDVEALLDGAAVAVDALRSGGAYSLASGNQSGALSTLDSALSDVLTAQGTVGSYQRSTLQPALRSNQVAIESLASARSTLVDTDYAEATSGLNRTAILNQSGINLIRVVQQQQRNVLSLLQ